MNALAYPSPPPKLFMAVTGNGYASAFIYGLLEGMEMMDCLELGSASASMLVASHGCSDDMPDIGTIRRFIAEEKKLYGEMIASV